MLYWEKHDHANNVHRWYGVTYGRDLLGDLVLTRAWGDIGRPGCRGKNLLLGAPGELREWLYVIGRQRDAKGYALKVRAI
jgi:hypothetical protein